MKVFFICFFILLFLFFGCASHQKETIITETRSEDKIELSVLEQGRQLLNHPTEDLFFSAYAKYHDAYPEDTALLLNEYKEKQEKLFIHALENENYPDSWFYYNNLLVFNKSIELNMDGFFNVLIQGFDEQGKKATSKYLSLMQGDKIEESESPLKEVRLFQEILVEIYVSIVYEDKYSMMRKDYSFGSGFFVNNSQIITAFHIIESCFAVHTKSFEISIKKDDTIFRNITIKSWDSLTDIVLLEIEDEQFDISHDFMSLLGNSDSLQQGDDIFCLGHHNGLTSTLTKGIVSATKRRAPEVGTWIQVDANIAPGASGGIAIGKDRKIYGMIVAGVVFEDLNFIVPSNLILSVIDRLRNGEQIRRPWIGLLLEEFWDKKSEIVIADIFTTSPLHMYDIKQGDKLLEINHEPIESIKAAQDIVNTLFAGNLVHLKIQNYSDEKDCLVLLQRRPDYPIYNATIDYNKKSSLYPHFGFGVRSGDIIQEEFSYQGKTFNITLYKVTRIRRYSLLDSNGVRIGDYIGFLSDQFINKTRYIEVLHIPKNKNIKNMKDFNIYDFIYRLEKGAYDENIL